MVYKFYYIVNNTYGHTTEYSDWNRWYFYHWFKAKGFTKASIAGIWGNIKAESSGGNPGQVEYGQTIPSYNINGIPDSAAYRGGFGFIQWTDTNSISNHLLSTSINREIAWYNGLMQCQLIFAEFDSGYWIPTSSYPYDKEEFMNLTNYEEATKAFYYERERGVSWSDVRLVGAEELMAESFTIKPAEPTDSSLSYTIGTDSGNEGTSRYWLLKSWCPQYGFTFGSLKK